MKTPRIGKSDLTSITTLLHQTQKKTQTAFVISKLRRVWKEVVGEMLYKQTRPKKAERGILWVSVDNSALNYELSMMKISILEKIMEASGQSYKDIKFIQESFTTPATPTETVAPKQKFVRTFAQEGESLEEILNRVKNLSKDLQKKF